MYGQIILTLFVLLDLSHMAGAHCMVHQIPPRNFTLPCMLLNETFLTPFSAGAAGSWAGLKREHRASETKSPLLVKEESFLCCLWSDDNINCSLYRASMQARKFIPSEISVSASQEIDSSWNIECWIPGKLDLLVCSLQIGKMHSRVNLKLQLFYAVSELSLGDVTTSSLKGPVGVAECGCGEQGSCGCCLPAPGLTHTYLLWLQGTAGLTPLWSPLMAVKPIDIVKPDPPLNLHLGMTEKGQVKICWSAPVLVPYPLQYEVRISADSGQNAWQVVQVAVNTSLALDNILLNSSYSAQVRCRNLHGPGFWSDWSPPQNLNLGAEVLYFPPKLLTSAGSNVSFYCIYKNNTELVAPEELVWWLNLAEAIPDNVNINITCETDGYLTKMTCRWSADPTTVLLGSSLQLRYYRSKIYCAEFPTTSPESEVKECHLQKNHSYECTFQPIFLLSGYTMWIEFKHSLGTLESSPTCVIPADVVKLLPPSSVQAEITRSGGLLNVSWTNPLFANGDLTFQIRFAVKGEDKAWELYEVSNAPGSAVIAVQRLCVEYIVQVRCREQDGSGYWSNWSRSTHTLVKDIQAPLRGPEFWRVITEDPARKQKNVTLLWKPLPRDQSLCSVSSYLVKHQASGNSTWAELVENGTTCSFPWTHPTHTITVLAMNSLGLSSLNFHLTLSLRMSTVSVVQTLRAYPVNSTCVILVWTLSPQTHRVTTFVLEWRNLNRAEEMKWVQVPPSLSKFYLYDHFILIEKYQFSLYPVFAEGVGKPRTTDQFTKGGYENESNSSLYVVLPIVISTSVLLLGALLVSHQRVKKLFWEDVPNPKNCSWAQGVNFQKPETLEHLFAKHPEATSFEPLLLEPEIVLGDISIAAALAGDDTRDFLATDSLFSQCGDSGRDSACSSSCSGSCRSAPGGGETPGRGDVNYASLLSCPGAQGLAEHTHNLPGGCQGCCLAGGSTGSFSGSSWEMGNGAFLLFPALPARQPSKTLSLLSSEGFSEPSDQDDAFADGESPERSLCYLGVTALEKGEGDVFLTESSRLMCQLHPGDQLNDLGFLQLAQPPLNPLLPSSLKYKAMVPYVPQFQMPAAKVQESTEKNS